MKKTLLILLLLLSCQALSALPSGLYAWRLNPVKYCADHVVREGRPVSHYMQRFR